jgi:HPt (histidine-containing phosphotransfer) domain-containing protein
MDECSSQQVRSTLDSFIRTRTQSMDILNEETLKSFKEIMDVQQYQQLIQFACNELAKGQSMMTTHLSQSEWDEVRFLAHKLKGSMGSLGCDRLFNLLNVLEKQLKEQPAKLPNQTQIDEVLQTLDTTLRALTAQAQAL